MLKEVTAKEFRHQFKTDPHPFVSEGFIELNKHKVDRVVRLIDSGTTTSFGFVAGVKDDILKSPFSAPFGGFHFRNQYQYVSEFDTFISELIEYAQSHQLVKIEITLPPDIYHQNFNAKTINSLIRLGFIPSLPAITNWVNLNKFNNTFTQRDSRTYLNQAIRNGLNFNLVVEEKDKREVFETVKNNRERFGRPIFMTYEDIIATTCLWPVDFFSVDNNNGAIVAGAVFYRAHPSISYAVFWGDNENGRAIRAMDFLSFSLWDYYKKLGYDYIDLGTSTEDGIPNNGLLRFKETHECSSSLRFSFTWTRE